MHIGCDGSGTNSGPVLENDSAGTAPCHDDLTHGRRNTDLDASSCSTARHRLRDGAHATDGVSPYAATPIHLSKVVVQLHVSGAGCVRTGVVADSKPNMAFTRSERNQRSR